MNDHLYWTVGAMALFGISEALSMIPSIKANGMFQLLFWIIKRVAGK